MKCGGYVVTTATVKITEMTL